MRILFATTCLTPIALLFAAPGNAETLIDAARTSAATTSTIKPGAIDDIRITARGSVTVITGTAVTLDSASKVTNEGAVKITDVSDATGILATAGTTGAISNVGTIVIDETYAPTDADKDGDLDGAFASGARRAGIKTAGAFTGTVANTGGITIEGNDSAGILLGGPLAGSLATSGAIAVTGDRSYGVRTDAITGAVRLAGAITVQGQGAVAALIGGDIGGALVVQGVLSATGYRATALAADVSKLDADDLLQGGPALSIVGNVAGGIILAVQPRDLDPKVDDEDKDGIPDASEGAASVVSYGSAAAVRIGAADRAVSVGAVAGSAFGLVIDGNVLGSGVYKDVTATGLQVGGGGAVGIAGGIAVNGAVQASSNNASATAIRIGSGATAPELRIAGAVLASGGGVAAATTTALAIDAGGSVATIRNSGQVKAVAAGVDGLTAAIVDRSGTLSLVENSGIIAATGAATGRNTAIDLRANTSGVVVRQVAPATGVTTAPSITGDIYFGSGNDTLALGGKSSFTGTTDFGGGSDQLTITENSRFSGAILRGSDLAVSVASGTLALGTKGPVALGSLNVGAEGVLGITIDAAAKTNTRFDVAGAATFAAGSQVALTLSNVSQAEGRYVIVRAGSISGTANLTASGMQLPYLFKSTVVSGTATEIAVDLKRKSVTELGLNGSQALAFDAVVTALDGDAKVASAVLDITDAARFGKTLRQMLPDHAGGSFEAVTQGSRATARLLADPEAPMRDNGGWSSWLQQVVWGRSKSIASTAGFDVSGWGVAAGGETPTRVGSFGLSGAFLHGKNADGGTDNEVGSDQYEAAAYWHVRSGGFRANARISAAQIGFDGVRRFDGLIGSEAVSRSAAAKWDGRLLSASSGVAYEARFGRLTLRPIAAVDYYHLKEDGYAETGGGKAFNLVVASRTSDELALSGTVAAGLNFGGVGAEDNWFRFEVEGGRRQLVGGSLGDTRAHFDGGKDFTLRAEDRTNGWVARVRATGGNGGFRLIGEFGAEEQQGRAAVSARAGVKFTL